MARINLTPFAIASKGEWLCHQMETLEALKEMAIVINTAPTGSGKTRAALSYFPHVDSGSILFVAPTNALLEQHQETIEKWVLSRKLSLKVTPLTKRILDQMEKESNLSRRGEVLHRFLCDGEQKVVITNPDIFYAILFCLYQGLDRRNLFADLIQQFSYVVIDEFHYYTAKQILAFEFFILLLKECGAFSHNRKFLFLTATPTMAFMSTIQKLSVPFRVVDGTHGGGRGGSSSSSGEHQHTEESKSGGKSEGREGTENKTFLSSMEMEVLPILPNGLVESFEAGLGNRIKEWLDMGLDGVIISNSLNSINTLFRSLYNWKIPQELCGRITGPVSHEERKRAGYRRLILATPTVDIGYNFEGLQKDRQNIDFVVCEAKTKDQFLQRIGRAGRLLGKEILDRPSYAVALVPKDDYAAFEEKEGQVFSREEFQEFLSDSLSIRREWEDYRLSFALIELGRPLKLLYDMTSQENRAKVERIYDIARAIYAPKFARSFKFSIMLHTELDQAAKFIKSPSINTPPDRWIKDFLTEYNNFEPGQRGMIEGYGEEELLSEINPMIEKNPRFRDELLCYLKERMAETTGLFSFRESFSGFQVFYIDENLFLSEARTGSYDLFHILRNYQIKILTPQEAKNWFSDEDLIEGRPVVKLLSPHDYPVDIVLEIYRKESVSFFEKRLYKISGLSGPKISLKDRKTKTEISVDKTVREFLSKETFPALFFPESSQAEAVCLNLLRNNSGFMIYSVIAHLEDEEKRFKAIFGTAAYYVYAEKFGFWKKKEKEEIVKFRHNDIELLIV